MSGSANVQVESANGRLAEISKCLSQQMSKPSQQKSRQQMSVSKSPVGKWKIGVSSNTMQKGRQVMALAFSFCTSLFSTLKNSKQTPIFNIFERQERQEKKL